MAKQKKQPEPKNIICECKLCINSIERDNKLHCKVYILDITKPLSSYSEVKTRKDCGYYREYRL